MQDLAPLLGYYGFLVSMLGIGLFFYYSMRYMRRKREENKIKDLLGK